MPDNTRVNELQDKLLQAMDIVNAHALSSISFDKTILCSIEDDSEKQYGKYIVTNGTQLFEAYSNDTKMRKGENVYVTIPQGDYGNQKMIIGKYTAETNQPYNFVSPFDTILDMTDNVVLGEIKNGALVANALDKYVANGEQEYITLYDKECNFYAYTRLGIKANFKSWIKDAVRGEYGLVIILTVNNPNVASSNELQNQDYYFTFSNLNMYGNTYNFETDYEQQIVLPLEDISGTITNIKINFYQKANFFDKFNEPLRCSTLGYKIKDNTNIYDKDSDDDYQLIENDILIEPNLFVSDIYLCFGYDISMFDNDYVEIYAQQSHTYKHSTDITNDGLAQNRKLIKMRWVHNDGETPVDMVAAADLINWDPSYEVRWYRYRIGAAAADRYCGVYWTQIDTNKFAIEFDPDVEMQRERIKAIIIHSSGAIYRSNEILFENEQELPPSAESQHIISALTIQADDGTNGNYMVYGQNNTIRDMTYSQQHRYLSAWFDANETGGLEENEVLTGNDQGKLLLWTFQAENSMIELLKDENYIMLAEIKEDGSIEVEWDYRQLEDSDNTEDEDIQPEEPVVPIDESEDDLEEETEEKLKKTVAYQILTDKPVYKIRSYYSSNYSNNTVTCQYELNGRVYTTEKEFTFGPFGTMGTEQTLVIDFIGDNKSVNLESEAEIKIGVQLYDAQNISQDLSGVEVTWKWYYHSGNNSMEFGSNSIITLTKDMFYNEDQMYLCILQATVGELTAYFPIPVQHNGYSFIKGPTQVIYQSNGEPSYNYEEYKLYDNNGVVSGVQWNTVCHENDLAKKYIGALTKDFRLKPLSIYVEDAPVYGVQATINGIVVWTQPILVLQNQWPNGVVNAWDGNSLVLDDKNNTILTAAISAGKKNSDNTFSGVMLGDWGKQDAEGTITKQTGIYGFHEGAMSYAFKEDGTAFIGKSSMARINFDGSSATIYSSGYYVNGNAGMIIDLYGQNENPYIELKSPDGNSRMKLDTANNGSTIYMSRNDGSITITNTDVTYPLKIGNNFSVKWNGNITSTGGTIGGWTISETELSSDDRHITLNTEGYGSIILDSPYSKISGGTIVGSTVQAGTLKSNDDTNRINLNGYLTVGNYGHLGYITSGIPGSDNKDGIGMDYAIGSDTYGEIKVTQVNSGLNFRTCYVSITGSSISIGCSDDNNNKTINFQKIKPENQHGIYARFA